MRVVAAALAAVLLGACEAPLRLEGVEQRQNEPVRRTDQFQAAASNDTAIVVVGNQGLVLTSTDAGVSWQRNKLSGWPSLIDVTACPDQSFAALAVEGQVWTSTDGTSSWISHPIETEEAAQTIRCDPRNRLWVIGSFASMFVSEDGAETWSLSSLDEDLIFTNIQFLDEQNVYIAGEFGTVMRSADAGATWDRLPVLVDEFYPQAMYFRDIDHGWIVGLGGAILHTTDAGESWQVQETETIAPLYGITEVAGGLYVVGGEAVMLKYVDEKWLRVQHESEARLFLRAMLAIGDDRLLVAGRAGALFVLNVDNLEIAEAP